MHPGRFGTRQRLSFAISRPPTLAHLLELSVLLRRRWVSPDRTETNRAFVNFETLSSSMEQGVEPFDGYATFSAEYP